MREFSFRPKLREFCVITVLTKIPMCFELPIFRLDVFVKGTLELKLKCLSR